LKAKSRERSATKKECERLTPCGISSQWALLREQGTMGART